MPLVCGPCSQCTFSVVNTTTGGIASLPWSSRDRLAVLLLLLLVAQLASQLASRLTGWLADWLADGWMEGSGGHGRGQVSGRRSGAPVLLCDIVRFLSTSCCCVVL